ncbi:MAG TPA: T9SS type A sorting domain-containing protein [Saprospiraceae bacterium]|nr:T9SS type A sorting domain-containing protein [Saprospiraceae bacterium]
MIKRSSLVLCIVLFFNLASAQFSPLCTGTTNGFVVDFASYQNEIFATGFFTTICGKSTGHVAKWNGTLWSQAAMGGIDEGHALEVIDDALYIASYEFGTDSNYIVRWNGTQLSSLGTVYRLNPNPSLGQSASIYDILKYGDDLVVCGEFNWVAGQPISGIARWNGVQWDSLGSGLSGSIAGTPALLYPHQMTVFDGDLIVCGNFLKAGGQTVNGIARWDGQNWSALGEGFNNTVYGVGIFDGVLYAGGAFTASGSTTLGRIARWNGAAWEHPGFEFAYSIAGVQPFIHTLRQVGDSLFIAGGFNQIKLLSGTTLNTSGIVVWNNQQLNTLGGGVPNREIEAIIPYNGGVLIGGGGSNSSGYLGFWNPNTSSLETLADQQETLRIYPNPASTYLNVSGCADCDYTLLSLKDANGKRCLETQLPAMSGPIQLPDLPSGLYFVQCSGSKTRSPLQQKVLILRE